MLFGSRLNKLATSIRRALSEYAVLGINPPFVADFIEKKYLTGGASSTFSNAITHARAGNATMTDGYGPELVTNGTFDSDSDWTKGTGWSIQNNRAYHASGANSNITQSIAVEAGKAYILEFDILEGSADFLWFAVDGVFTAVDNPQVRGGRSFVFTHDTTETIAVGVRAGSSNVATIDNVSVREMPVIKWAPHNLLQYSEQFDLWAGQTNVSVTPNAETSPDGTQTADALVYSATNGIIQRTVQNLVVGASYTFSVWLKADSNVTARIGGFVSGFTDAVTVNVTTEWQQFYVEASVVQTSRYPQIRSDGADTIYVWGAHVYRSDLGGMVDNPDRGDSYVPTTSSDKYLPRVGHHVYNGGSAWVNEGVLAESEQRVNLIEYSDFSSGWVESSVEPIAFNQTGPDGVANSAITLQDNGAGGSSGNVYIQDNGISISASTIHTASVFVKAGNNSQIEIETRNDDAVRGGLFDISTETFTPSASETGTIQSVGNGWYRCALTWTSGADTSIGLRVGFPNITRDGTNTIYLYGAQFEAGSTPSSLIPTSGQQGTRAAESFTIPSANLPWPTPVYTGSELLDNGDFELGDNGDWTKFGTITIASGEATLDSSGSTLVQAITTVIGDVYDIDVNVSAGASAASVRAGTTQGGAENLQSETITTSGIYSFQFVATATTTHISLVNGASSTTDFTVGSVSVRQINPLSVSIAMDGRITYADEDENFQIKFLQWLEDGSNFIELSVTTASTTTGRMDFRQEVGGANDFVSSGNTYFSPDILVPFNIASRHGSTFINGAVDGVALTANTTPTALPDLSATDLDLAYDYMGTISEFRVWDRDIGDTGLVEATNPSLEPSLSLTFEGTGTNSFVVNNWSE